MPDALTAPESAAPEAPARSAADAVAPDEAATARPSDRPSILLRGPRSVRPDPGREPLYIVDGVIMGGADGVRGLDPDAIESIEVIKGTSAGPVSGSLVGNVVILITTRNARSRARR
ncbi:MAG TPA: TonB-dependent receptor plug domain-containing protein [Longimicrobium sp.]|nr:TonB-dependent receptor plug domain-containing protein [Longimicrobium sp.]